MSDNWHMGELFEYPSYLVVFDKILNRGTNDMSVRLKYPNICWVE